MDQSKTPRHDCRSCRYLTSRRGVLDLSVIQWPFSITKCQILISRFATFSSLYVARRFSPRGAPRVKTGFGFVHHSMAILYHEVPDPFLTIRHFFIAVRPPPSRPQAEPGCVRRPVDLRVPLGDATPLHPPMPPHERERGSLGALYGGCLAHPGHPAAAALLDALLTRPTREVPLPRACLAALGPGAEPEWMRRVALRRPI
jgi:hypothetical protein